MFFKFFSRQSCIFKYCSSLCKPWGNAPVRLSLILSMEIDHKIVSKAILLPSTDSRRVVVSNKPKYVNEVLVNCSVKLAQEGVVR